jgi:hypothetical protein
LFCKPGGGAQLPRPRLLRRAGRLWRGFRHPGVGIGGAGGQLVRPGGEPLRSGRRTGDGPGARCGGPLGGHSPPSHRGGARGKPGRRGRGRLPLRPSRRRRLGPSPLGRSRSPLSSRQRRRPPRRFGGPKRLQGRRKRRRRQPRRPRPNAPTPLRRGLPIAKPMRRRDGRRAVRRRRKSPRLARERAADPASTAAMRGPPPSAWCATTANLRRWIAG